MIDGKYSTFKEKAKAENAARKELEQLGVNITFCRKNFAYEVDEFKKKFNSYVEALAYFKGRKMYTRSLWTTNGIVVKNCLKQGRKYIWSLWIYDVLEIVCPAQAGWKN